MSTKDVCIGCDYRSDQDIPADIRFGPKYNPPKFCSLGYTQNPKTPEAIAHSLNNHAEVCNRIIKASFGNRETSVSGLRILQEAQ